MRRLGGRTVLGGTGAGATARRLATLVPLLLMAACGRSPDRTDGDAPRLYVTSGFTDEVHVLDARDGTILRTIPLDRRRTETDEPHGVTVAPDGRHWYATLAHGHPTLWKYETDGDRLVGRLQLDIPGAARVELTPDGGRAFIPDYWRGGLGEESRVAVVDVHDLTVAAVPVVCPAPHHAAVDPSGTRVAVTCSLSDEIALMEVGSARTLNRLPAGPEPGTAGTPRYAPMNAAWSPDGARFYVTMAGTGEVRAYSRTGDARGAVAVGEGPAQIAASADGRVLVVANRGGASVSVLDPTLLREVRRIELAGAAFPHGIALDRAGEVAYTTWEGRVGEPGGVAALRIGSGEVLWRREVGVLTLGVAYLPGRAEERPQLRSVPGVEPPGAFPDAGKQVPVVCHGAPEYRGQPSGDATARPSSGLCSGHCAVAVRLRRSFHGSTSRAGTTVSACRPRRTAYASTKAMPISVSPVPTPSAQTTPRCRLTMPGARRKPSSRKGARLTARGGGPSPSRTSPKGDDPDDRTGSTGSRSRQACRRPSPYQLPEWRAGFLTSAIVNPAVCL